MSQTIAAIFENGVFRPLEKVDHIRARFVRIEIKPADEAEPSIQGMVKKYYFPVLKSEDYTRYNFC